MATINRLAAIKEIGAIEYRIADTTLPTSIRRDIISRNVQNLVCDLTLTAAHSAKFGGILERLAARHTSDLEIIAGCALLRSLISLTLGCIPAGNVVRIPDGRVVVKRKEHLELLSDGTVIDHLPPDTSVIVINA